MGQTQRVRRLEALHRRVLRNYEHNNNNLRSPLIIGFGATNDEYYFYYNGMETQKDFTFFSLCQLLYTLCFLSDKQITAPPFLFFLLGKKVGRRRRRGGITLALLQIQAFRFLVTCIIIVSFPSFSFLTCALLWKRGLRGKGCFFFPFSGFPTKAGPLDGDGLGGLWLQRNGACGRGSVGVGVGCFFPFCQTFFNLSEADSRGLYLWNFPAIFLS